MKLILWSLEIFIIVSVVVSEIATPVWQQYYPGNHAWASISELQNRFRRVRMGQGRYRMMPTGNAEVTCEFPDSMLMISNIIWERADMGTRDLSSLYRRHGISHQYDIHTRPHGSTLHLFDVNPLDRGLYRCLATALDPGTNQVVTMFQDTEFYPDFRGFHQI
ncbi:uncharacterized protein LOC135837871 [Planococcus citri]|uniref:uncharacterized protein LOC135837871 n=1 Tax=Planococcus citri TaxID=170843 RepID=UPI0031F7A42E